MTGTHLRFLLLISLLSLWALPVIAAPKTDIVFFKNGDKLTGEVKSLRRGRLSLNTDATGTINIEWDKIAGIVSDQHIQVELASGTRYFGSLTSLEDAPELVVITDTESQKLDPDRVVIMEPIEGGGIHALDVDVSLGYNFAKAGGVTSATVGLNMDWRSLIRIESLDFSTTLTDSDTQEASKRLVLGLQHTRLWSDRWFTNANLTFNQNDELGLDLRTSLGAGGGRFLIQSNRMLFSLEAGIQVSREDLKNEAEYTDSVEATFTTRWDWFVFQNPELDWSTFLQLIPSLTESGRLRAEFDTTLKWELIDDLNWGFSFYTSYDNQSESAEGSTSDYGVNTTISYEF